MSGAFLGNVKALNVISVALAPVSVAANTTVAQTFTVPGILVGDYIEVNKPTLQAGLALGDAFVSGTNTISLTYANNTASPIVPATETYIMLVARPEVVGATALYA